ncbi:lysM and putative peptidoglycan-binding domain-containing protein 2 [Elysia marginata]|uniref:LysM and putative peptidoglycan-binding domain-containing protein 2 n=1 Tax=Elysia marginata TaxID=1093978 RepID=A0AAV4I2Z9_9GAST|nr:lysM and putative peptidoglycan-binding domain-containing protein 2 [Elysia marginata]
MGQADVMNSEPIHLALKTLDKHGGRARRRRVHIRHRLTRVDTLNSLALKYNVSVQELKRENKLWNTDHLFLREEILIPLTAENEGLLDENDTIVVHDGFSSSHSSNSLSSPDAAGPSGSFPNGQASFSSSSSSSNGNGGRGLLSSDPLSSFSSSSTSSSKGLRASSFPSSSHQPSSFSSPSSSLSSSSFSKGKSRQAPGFNNSNNNNNNAGGTGSTIGAAESSVSSGSSSMAEDFFSKYDTSIAQLRGDVEKMEKNAA